jgi:hypothetical protein
VTLQGGVFAAVSTPIAAAISVSLALRAKKRVGTVRLPSHKTVISNSPNFTRCRGAAKTRAVSGDAAPSPTKSARLFKGEPCTLLHGNGSSAIPIVTAQTLRLFCIGLPAAVIGTWLGLKLYGNLEEASFRMVVLMLLLVSDPEMSS